MNRLSTLLCSVIAGALVLSGTARAVPALGDPREIYQSDGTSFVAADKGDEWQNWVETPAGFTVAPDASGIWRYVSAFDASGNPVLLNTPATGNPPPGLAKHVVPPSRRPAQAPGLAARSIASGDGVQAVSGNSTSPVLFILAEFSDRKGSTSEASWAGFVANNVGDYFSKTSHGNAVVIGANELHGGQNDGVVGWIDMGYAHPNNGGSIDERNRQLAKDAVLAADAYVDFSIYDTNGNGYVDGDELGVVVIVAGYERSYSSAYSPNVWGHKWTTYAGTGYPLVDGVRVTEYAQFGELHGTHQATMGIMVHELGHLLYGLPDLYDTDSSSSGIGGFGLMGGGSWGQASTDSWAGQTPVNVCAWTKKRMGWANVLEGSGTVTVMASGDPSSPDHRVHRASTDVSSQYFLIENRQPTGYDRGLWRWLGSNFGGVAIWHVDDSKSDNRDDANRWVDLEEADGGQLGTGRGYAAALWSSPDATTFDDGTTPSSRLYDGSASGVSVNNISGSSSAMLATFGQVVTNAPPTADFSFSASDLTVSFIDTSTDSDGSIASWSWDFGDGTGTTVRNPGHTYAAAGTYTVTLSVVDNEGADDSISQQITVAAPNQPPTANFSFSASDLTVSFTDTSTDSDGSIASWSWDFGDGTGATVRNPSHTYAAAGTYMVTLIVADNDGATGSRSSQVTVTDPATPQPPAAPSNLTGNLQKSGRGKNKVVTSATLSWTDNADNEMGFEVERCQEIRTGKGKNKTVTCDYATFAVLGANVTQLDIQPPESGYRYRVRAFNEIGSSGYSNEVDL